MIILNREAFMKLPVGTLYAKFDPYCMEGLSFKGENSSGDFYSCDVSSALSSAPDYGNMTGEEHEALLQQVQTGGARLDHCIAAAYCRDGCFDHDQLFAVWETSDIEELIELLVESRRVSHTYGKPE